MVKRKASSKPARTPQEGSSPTVCYVLEEVSFASILKFIVYLPYA